MGVFISEVARRAGVSVDTIRFYERRGLINPSSVRRSGYRVYDEQLVDDVLFIRKGRELGFTLKEIEQLMLQGPETHANCQNVQQLTRQKLDELDAKMTELKAIEQPLTRFIKSCDSRRTNDKCPCLIVEKLSGDHIDTG